MIEDIPFPLPVSDEISEPYWEALRTGRHVFQRCVVCANAWLPPRRECPRCLQKAWAWEEASGDARLVSWVVYHTAFHPAFEDRLPYTVAIVELVEGPRLISSLIDVPDPESLVIDQPLRLAIEDERGVAIPRYRPAAA